MVDVRRVAAVQLQSTSEVAHNLDQARHLLEQAAKDGAQLVVLPENYGLCGGPGAVLPHAQALESHSFLTPLRDAAQRLRVHVIAGSLPERGPDAQHCYATQVVVGPSGQLEACYRKLHLFAIDSPETSLSEPAYITPGDKVGTWAWGAWTVGLSICFDLRFAALYRAHRHLGATIAVVPSAFTLHTGKDHWETLVRARAIENQMYVIAANQQGSHGAGRGSWGKSMIVDPWGTILASCPERPSYAVADCDMAALLQVRRNLPLAHHDVLPAAL